MNPSRSRSWNASSTGSSTPTTTTGSASSSSSSTSRLERAHLVGYGDESEVDDLRRYPQLIVRQHH